MVYGTTSRRLKFRSLMPRERATTPPTIERSAIRRRGAADMEPDIDALVASVRENGFCLLKNIIPQEDIATVRKGFLRARDSHRAAVERLEGGPQRPQGMKPNEAANLVLERGLRKIQAQLTDPATSRAQAIALVDGLAAELRDSGTLGNAGKLLPGGGATGLSVPTDEERGPPPLPAHEISHFPQFSKYIADERLLAVVRNVLDPHARVYQVEFGKTIAGVL